MYVFILSVNPFVELNTANIWQLQNNLQIFEGLFSCAISPAHYACGNRRKIDFLRASYALTYLGARDALRFDVLDSVQPHA